MGVLAFGEFEADLERFELRRAGIRVEISAKCFDVLVYLIRHRERVVSKAELVEMVWKTQALSTSAVPTAILGLRQALGDEDESARHVANVRGRGYRFVAEVREAVAAPEESSSAVGGPRVRRGTSSGFVGRGQELAAIASAYERCAEGIPQTVLVAGEAGIGKTRMAEEFAGQARERGATVLVGRCREGEGAPAFWPWVQVVRELIERMGSEALERDVRRLASVLSQMVPEIGDHFPGLEPPPPLEAEPARFRLFDTVTRLLQKAGSRHPLLIVLDDLHRADLASLHFLAFVVRELREARVLLLVTYRDVDTQRDPPRLTAITDLARQEPSRSLQLHGLTSSEVAEFVAASAMRSSGSDALTQRLHEQSGGNPFFLTQLVHALEAEGGPERISLDASLPSLLPGGVREAIAKQLECLPDESRRGLGVAAAIGREFPAAAIADVMALPTRRVLALLEPAIDARLVIEIPDRIGHLRFAHVLLRDSVYDQLEIVERVDLHQRIARSLERIYADDLGPHASELAHHFLEALHESGSAPAVRYAVLAGDWASARLAYEDAARHYRSALRILEESGPGKLVQRCELLQKLGESEMNAGERDRARNAFYDAAECAKRAGHPELLARAALRLAPGFFTIEIGVVDSILVNLLEDALSTLGPADSPLRAQLLARLAMSHGWTGAEEIRSKLTFEAIEVAKRVRDPGSLAYALSANHGLLWGPERVAERVVLIDQLGALAMESRDTDLILMHLLFRVTSDLELGKMVEFDRDIAAYVQIAEPLNQPQSLWYAHNFRAARSLLMGRFSESAVHSERVLATGGRINDVNAMNSFGIHAAIQLWERGRADQVVPFADSFVQKYPAIAGWQFSRAFMHFEAGLVQEARSQFDALAQCNFARIPRNEQWSVCAALAADLCYRLEDRERAELLYPQLLEARSLYCVVGFGVANLGSFALRLAMLASVLGRWDLAEAHFEDAIRMEVSIGSLPWLVHTLYWNALSIVARGQSKDMVRADEICERALQIVDTIGMPNLTQKLQRLRHAINGGRVVGASELH